MRVDESDASYVRVIAPEDKYFSVQAFKLHRNEAPKFMFWFDLVHTGHIGTSAVLAPGFSSQPYL